MYIPAEYRNPNVTRMKHVVNGRPVVFLGHGHSLCHFRDHIQSYRNWDCCFVSLNRVHIVRDILKLIDRDLDIILGFASGYEDSFKDEKCYVHRYAVGRGNSLCEFLCQCDEANISPIYLIGCDGYSDGDMAYYSNPCCCDQQIQRHIEDTRAFNNYFTNNTLSIEVHNLNPNSHYQIGRDDSLYGFDKAA